MGSLTPSDLAIGLAAIAGAVILGRLRRQPGLVIAMNTAGAICFLGGIRWAIAIGDGAFAAVAIATFGFVLFDLAAQRSHPKAASA